MFSVSRLPVGAALAGTLLAGLLAGCGSGTGSAESGELSVVTAFYPLQYATKQVGGDRVHVTNLTKAGDEPHDLELTPKDIATVAEADLVVYLKGFQPAVDEAVKQAGSGPAVLDAGEHADLLPVVEPPSNPGGPPQENPGAFEEEGEHHEHEEGAADPHFWLDPVRYSAVVEAIADRLGTVDADHAAAYAKAGSRLSERLTALDRRFETGLRTCESRDLVTSHAAFGYLAARYDLHQVAIAGLSPENEPSPGAQAEIAEFVGDHDVRTIYYETLVDPAVATSVAAETGAAVAVLDPLEGLTEDSPGRDYLGVMEANLTALQKGQRCS